MGVVAAIFSASQLPRATSKLCFHHCNQFASLGILAVEVDSLAVKVGKLKVDILVAKVDILVAKEDILATKVTLLSDALFKGSTEQNCRGLWIR